MTDEEKPTVTAVTMEDLGIPAMIEHLFVGEPEGHDSPVVFIVMKTAIGMPVSIGVPYESLDDMLNHVRELATSAYEAYSNAGTFIDNELRDMLNAPPPVDEGP